MAVQPSCDSKQIERCDPDLTLASTQLHARMILIKTFLNEVSLVQRSQIFAIVGFCVRLKGCYPVAEVVMRDLSPRCPLFLRHEV